MTPATGPACHRADVFSNALRRPYSLGAEGTVAPQECRYVLGTPVVFYMRAHMHRDRNLQEAARFILVRKETESRVQLIPNKLGILGEFLHKLHYNVVSC